MSKHWTPIKGLEVAAPNLASLERGQLENMLAAGHQARECHRVLKKGGANIVGEMLKGGGTFYEYDHYPDGDVYDEETFSQFYYHAHRGLAGEHGHFHTFIRQKGIPAHVLPVPYDGGTPWPTGSDIICHFIAISMDLYGFPLGLFATNRWVTDENWYSSDDAISMLPQFEIDHAVPSWPTNVWITALTRLFRPQVEALLRHRDEVVSAWADAHAGTDVFEDRDLEMTGWVRISIEDQIAAVQDEINKKP